MVDDSIASSVDQYTVVVDDSFASSVDRYTVVVEHLSWLACLLPTNDRSAVLITRTIFTLETRKQTCERVLCNNYRVFLKSVPEPSSLGTA